MNRKRNVNFIKPEDPPFLKALKIQAGYDDRNHKFDVLENAEDDFADDRDSEKPQVVVLENGDLTATEAELEQEKIEKVESGIKADLNQKVIFKQKQTLDPEMKRKKPNNDSKVKATKKNCLLSFDDEDDDEED